MYINIYICERNTGIHKHVGACKKIYVPVYANELAYYILCTPLQTNMDLENHWFVKDHHLPRVHFQGPCSCSGGYPFAHMVEHENKSTPPAKPALSLN